MAKAEFSKLYITSKGETLAAKVDAGNTSLEFTKMCASSTVYAESSLTSLTSLDGIKQTVDISRVTVMDSGTIKVEAAFINKYASGEYYIRALGLYANDPDVGEILYGVCIETTGLCYMPSYDGVKPYSAYVQIFTTVGNVEGVSLTIYSGAFVTQDDLDGLVDDLEERVSDLEAFVGYTDDDIYGVEVDFANKTLTRLAGAVDRSSGSGFDDIHAFGGRRRCNLADDGTVNAYYGDEGYTEDGSNGQVMVEQPKFFYRVVPLETEIISEGNNKGYHMRKARYYVSDTPKTGFKLHPAFVENGNANDYIYLSAFEGCLYDSDAGEYILDDSQVMDTSADKLSSIAGAIPASGVTQALTRKNTRLLAENRGAGWEQSYAATIAASQMLMLIEYASFNMQSKIGNGVIGKTDDSTTNMAEATGGTSSLGNASGAVTNDNGYVCVSYRGEENLWANIWKWIDGMNEYNGDSFESGDYGTLYIADHDFADDTGDDAYQDTGIHPCYTTGSYIKAFGYSKDFDFLFIPTEIGGTSSLPVGDYFYNQNTGWRVAILGSAWNSTSHAGAFSWNLHDASSHRSRNVGGRLVYVPSKNDEEEAA